MKKFIIFALIAFALLGIVFAFIQLNATDTSKSSSVSLSKDKVLIGFSLGTSREERWVKDADLFAERAKELGADVVVKYSGEDSNLQISQAENLIIQGVQALVVVPNDAISSARIVDMAHAAKIPVIAYDRMITKSDVDFYITFDGRKLGELQAQEIVKRVPKGNFAYIGGSPTDNNAFLLKEGSMKVLDPLIKKNTITIVVDAFSMSWQPEEAYKTIKTYLASGKKLDAVVAANDGTAGGVIRALNEFGLAGKVPVSGQDADTTACQRVVAGTQSMTIYKPIKTLAYKSAEAAVDFALGKKPLSNGTINNGTKDVVSYFIDPVVVTKENIDSVIITGGFHTYDEVYGTK